MGGPLRALERLVKSAGLSTCMFASAQGFLDADVGDATGCLVLDVRMPGLDGFDLQKALDDAGLHMPIVFITGHSDVPMAIRAMKAGAVTLLEKPFCDEEILDAINEAIARDAGMRSDRAEVEAIRERLDRLTPRESEVRPYVVSGSLNKQTAQVLGTSEKTIKVHRSRIMRKMAAESLPDLVRMAERLGLSLPDG